MKRALTDQEINDIIQDIKFKGHVVPDIAENLTSKSRRRCIEQLKQVRIYPDKIGDLKRMIVEQFNRSLISPGESVGILTAQSIGERQTQLMLDSFHSSGISNNMLVTGVPRFQELINATKNPKGVVSTVSLRDDFNSIRHIQQTLRKELPHTTLQTFVSETKHNLSNTFQPLWDTYCSLYGITLFPRYDGVSFIMSPEQMFFYRIPMKQIASTLQQTFPELVIIPSPNNFLTINVFYDTDQIEEQSRKRFKENMLIPSLLSATITGIQGLGPIFFKEGDDGRWCVELGGGNLRRLLYHPRVKGQDTWSNNMWEIMDVLGIEATREFLIQEFEYVISNDSFMNRRHIQLLVDVMTFTGTITAISRYGVSRNQSGPITKASFEETLDNFLKAGLYGDIETTRGVSASIVCGKPIVSGTGACEIIYDETFEC